MSTVSAAQAVGEYLQSPDDLMKTIAFRKKLEKEKASIDSKLRSGVREQLDATREGLRKLLGTRENVNALREEIRGIEILFKDDKNEVKTFDQISRVSEVCSLTANCDGSLRQLSTPSQRSPYSIDLHTLPLPCPTAFASSPNPSPLLPLLSGLSCPPELRPNRRNGGQPNGYVQPSL